MGVSCDRLMLGSTAALNCWTGQNKGRYWEKEFLFLLVKSKLYVWKFQLPGQLIEIQN